jgi:uncharacterized protein involved in outer membrane biogenesis
VLVVAAAAAIPLFVDANTFRPVIETRLTRTLGRDVKLGDLRLSVFSRSLVAKDVSLPDDPNFSAEPFLTANEVRIGVSLRRLIFSHEVVLRDFEIESPQITVIRGSNGAWNFSSVAHRAASGAPAGGSVAESTASGTSESSRAAPLPDLGVDRIAVADGRVALTAAPAQGQAAVYDHVHITARDFAFALQFPFEFSSDLPAVAPSAADATGTLGAVNFEVPLLDLKLSGQNLQIDELPSLMTAAAVRLSNGSKLKGGMLAMRLAVTGPAKSLIITGPIAIDNTRLVGFDVGSKIHGIATRSGVKTGDTTEIEKLRVKVRVKNGGIVADRVSP